MVESGFVRSGETVLWPRRVPMTVDGTQDLGGAVMKSLVAVAAAVLLALAVAATGLAQEGDGPHLVDRNLTVTETIGDLVTPIGIAFLGPDDMLVIEKN